MSSNPNVIFLDLIVPADVELYHGLKQEGPRLVRDVYEVQIGNGV